MDGTSALANDTAYTVQVRGYDGTEYGSWMTASFTTDSGAPAAPTLTCTGYPSGSWSALISGGTTCTLSDSSPLIEGYAYGIQDGSGTATWTWTTNPTITIDPTSDGEYTISYQVTDDANVTTSAAASYTFGVGADGAMLTPADGSQTATSVSLQAAAPAGYTSATFEYREGSTGSFQDIPDQVVDDCGCPVTWPVSTSTDSTGVTTDSLTWYVTRTASRRRPGADRGGVHQLLRRHRHHAAGHRHPRTGSAPAPTTAPPRSGRSRSACNPATPRCRPPT